MTQETDEALDWAIRQVARYTHAVSLHPMDLDELTTRQRTERANLEHWQRRLDAYRQKHPEQEQPLVDLHQDPVAPPVPLRSGASLDEIAHVSAHYLCLGGTASNRVTAARSAAAVTPFLGRLGTGRSVALTYAPSQIPRSEGTTMTKNLQYLGTGSPSDPLKAIAGDILAVKALNGHEPDDDEIRAELDAAAVDASPENVAKVRQYVDHSQS